jgi:hypothetical protein
VGCHRILAADSHPRVHLAGLSLAWIYEMRRGRGARHVKTARNLDACPVARVGAGAARDVVMLEVALEHRLSAGADEALREAHQAQADWDPGPEVGYEFLVLGPTRIEAWRERDEISGRDLMVDVRWLD